MPPKKKAAASEGAEAEAGPQPFRWTLENERKLLILTQGRYLTTEDYERLLTVFPGTNYNGVKIKVSRFRVEQRKLYEELGWPLPEGGAKAKGSGGQGKKGKRAAEEMERDEEGGGGKKKKGVEEVKIKEEGEGSGE